MRPIKYLVLHCSATREGIHIDKSDIERMHLKERGWSKLGYHRLFLLDGTIETLHEHDGDDYLTLAERANGCWGINQISLHWCYAGGVDRKGQPKDTRTLEQRDAMEWYIKEYIRKFPSIKILGHNQAIHPTRSPKACPSFFVPEWLEDIGVYPVNIEYKRSIFKD